MFLNVPISEHRTFDQRFWQRDVSRNTHAYAMFRTYVAPNDGLPRARCDIVIINPTPRFKCEAVRPDCPASYINYAKQAYTKY